MSNLNDISLDKIETDVMSVLYANMDIVFTQYSLFSKLIEDKYDFKNTISIHPNFKSKFLLVIRNLISKYPNIKITRDNLVFNILCSNSPDSPNNPDNKFPRFTKIQNNEPINEPNNKPNNEPNNEPNNKSNTSSTIKLDENDISEMYDYIYDNNLNEYINWSDPVDGNTIYHELVLSNNIKQIERLVKENLFEYTVLNTYNQTPIDLIKSPLVARIMTMGLVKNYNSIKEKLNQEKEKLNQEKENVNMLVNNFNNKINYYESDKYIDKIINDTNFIDIIYIKTHHYHFKIKLYLLSILMCYIAFRFF